MLQLLNGAIQELPSEVTATDTRYMFNERKASASATNMVNWIGWPSTSYWNSYPVYVTTDKTAKAIEILKCLQSEKIIEVKSVPKFIELVEKIASKL